MKLELKPIVNGKDCRFNPGDFVAKFGFILVSLVFTRGALLRTASFFYSVSVITGSSLVFWEESIID
jgi:hypothetical protein